MGARYKAMTCFTEVLDCLKSNLHVKELGVRLSEALSTSRLNHWKARDNIASAKRRVLIGVAPYSQYDLKLLEALNELPLDPASDRIDVFDVLACQTQEDFEEYVPGIGKVYQTPVVGIWRNGKLEERNSGHSARELLMRLYGIKIGQLL